ncbi:MAG: hypothetical protein ACKOXB_04805 [Flavobacteriales bacterium]
MKHITILLSILLTIAACSSPESIHRENPPLSKKENNTSSIVCNDSMCTGSYEGPEFIRSSDVAHQFSNKMCDTVGDILKKLYAEEKYSSVNFSGIKMSTEGMGSGKVRYTLSVPFQRVNNKCEAYTSFDHVGGWAHTPALEERKKQLQKALAQGEKLNISDLKTTPEGLQEYWIQWRNKIVQADCIK